MAGAKYRADNLIAIVDANTAQQTGYTRDILPTEPKRLRVGRPGGDFDSLLPALRKAGASGSGKPQAVVARTLKGVSFVEKDYGYHGKPLSRDELKRALEELGWS